MRDLETRERHANMIVPYIPAAASSTSHRNLDSPIEAPPQALAPTAPPAFASLVFGDRRASAKFHSPTGGGGAGRSSGAQREAVGAKAQTSSCASGVAFYRCANGFTGCCSVNPCDPGATCPDGMRMSAASTMMTTATTTAKSVTITVPIKTTNAAGILDSTTAMSMWMTSSATTKPPASASSSLASASTLVPALSAPACPAGNGTIFTDDSSIAYTIRCAADNSFSSFSSVNVGTGGYAECFSACSMASCAGFTFVGSDAGICYLKAKMPGAQFSATAADNYVSCAKVDAGAVAPSPSTTPRTTEKSSTGAIAGGIVGGIALLALLLLLTALLAKRRRRKIEERRATVTHLYQGPIEPQQQQQLFGTTDYSPSSQSTYQPPTAAAVGGGGIAPHQRQGSTAHDAFAPFGGSYYPPSPSHPQTHTRQRSIYTSQGSELPQWV